MRYKTNLAKLIEEAEEYEWFFDIYMPNGAELSGDTNVLIINDDDEDERDEFDEPAYPKKIGFCLLLSISQLLEVLDNSMAEDLPGIIEAINYYYENDAFIN